MSVLRNTQGYTIEKVKRDALGSYAIIFGGKKSDHNYNAGTVKHFLKMTDQEFLDYAKTQFNT